MTMRGRAAVPQSSHSLSHRKSSLSFFRPNNKTNKDEILRRVPIRPRAGVGVAGCAPAEAGGGGGEGGRAEGEHPAGAGGARAGQGGAERRDAGQGGAPRDARARQSRGCW